MQEVWSVRDFLGGVAMNEPMHPVHADGSVQILVRLMRDIAQSLVDDTASVLVDAIPDGDGTLLRLRVAPGEVGKVIGKQGRTARSLRTILGAAGMKLKHRLSLDIVEEARDQVQPKLPSQDGFA